MGLKKDILDKIKTHIDNKFDIQDVTYVPNLDDKKLTFGNTGLKFDSTVLYIDLRGSTSLINLHSKSIVAEIHKAYYYTIVKIATSLKGENRSFNGDSLLIFFQGNSQDALSNAVMAAMKMVYMLTNSEGISKHLSKYTSIDFGIGIDYGDILCTKVGIGGTYDNKDLIWIGNAVNKSTVLSDKGKDSSNYIYVSKIVYDNLNDNVKYHITKDAWGQERKVNMWNSATVLYNNINETCYYTTYHWTIQ